MKNTKTSAIRFTPKIRRIIRMLKQEKKICRTRKNGSTIFWVLPVPSRKNTQKVKRTLAAYFFYNKLKTNLMQTTNHLLTVRPLRFGRNAQTAESNAFQQESGSESEEAVQEKAVAEFDGFVAELKSKGADITVIFDTEEPHTPDSIFPNNWFSTHSDGSLILYPMEAPNRRLERRRSIIDLLSGSFVINNETDLSYYEEEGKFLEGTGSMILDREFKIVYACRASRTNSEVLGDFCKKKGYTKILFDAKDGRSFPIYHTNVMMCLGSRFAVICAEAISDETERLKTLKSLGDTGREVIEITNKQVDAFAGNMLEISGKDGESLTVMSEQAYKSLRPAQIAGIEKYSRPVFAPLYTIEKYGGGSARCMLSELFLPVKN